MCTYMYVCNHTYFSLYVFFKNLKCFYTKTAYKNCDYEMLHIRSSGLSLAFNC